jgi:hypothetical protein
LGQPAFVDQIERAGKHRLGLGREARDDVAAERHVGPQPPHLRAERNGVGARMAALHALEDDVVAGLQRQMQMRHQPARRAQRVEQIGIGLHRIDRDSRSRWSSGTSRRNLLHQRSQPRRIARDVDAGQHDLAVSAVPPAACACATTSPTGTDRELPRPNGMMQKVQRWSQPFCTGGTRGCGRRCDRSDAARWSAPP